MMKTENFECFCFIMIVNLILVIVMNRLNSVYMDLVLQPNMVSISVFLSMINNMKNIIIINKMFIVSYMLMNIIYSMMLLMKEVILLLI
jgi:hypothetical protein